MEAALATLGLIEEIRSPYIVGVELSGDPRGECKFQDFVPALERARKDMNLKVSLHCAEHEEQIPEAQAMIDFRPDRLGHCCFLTAKQLEQVH